MNINFVFVAEGSSDYALVTHLEALCSYCGATEVTGVALEFERLPSSVGRSVLNKLTAAQKAEPGANLFFVHRDSDSRDSSSRYQEIRAAVETCQLTVDWVAVVPIQETEAWLLLDDIEIRRVARKPKGSVRLELPSPQQVENVANPKERLKAVLIEASEASGRRLDRIRSDFPNQRELLTRRLSVEGPLSSVPSWVRMRDDLQRIIKERKSE